MVRPPKLYTRRLGRSVSSLRIPWDYPTVLPLLWKRENMGVGLVLTQQGLHHIGPVYVGCCSPACSLRRLQQPYHSQANQRKSWTAALFPGSSRFSLLLAASTYPTYLPALCFLSSTRTNELRCRQIEIFNINAHSPSSPDRAVRRTPWDQTCWRTAVLSWLPSGPSRLA